MTTALPHARLVFADQAALEREQPNLRRGSVFIAGGTGLHQGAQCEVELVHPLGHRVALLAEAVLVTAQGTAFCFLDPHQAALDPFLRIDSPEQLSEPEPSDAEDHPSRSVPLVHERLRGLSVTEQQRVARDGDMNERIMLERIYSKSVWETLLRNPRLTVVEVARIARMGNLPRPLIEIVLGNGAWLQSPQVRRALLSNPRLAPDMVLKVMQVMPKAELKLVPQQTAYPQSVRAAAKRLIKP